MRRPAQLSITGLGKRKHMIRPGAVVATKKEKPTTEPTGPESSLSRTVSLELQLNKSIELAAVAVAFRAPSADAGLTRA